MPNRDDRHLDAADLDGLLARTLSNDASRQVIAHLVRGCEACRKRVRAGLERERAAPTAASEAATDAALDAALDRSGAFIGRHLADLEAGALLWGELRRQPAGRRLTLVRNSRRYSTAGTLRALLRDYREGAWREPEEGLAIAELGMAIAERLDAAGYRASWLADLRGEALAIGGNALRLAGRCREAGKLLEQAARWLSVGSGDLLTEAQLLTYQASRWQALGRFEKAARTLGRAEQAYREVGEMHLAARSLVARAEAIGNVDPEEGVRLIRQALPDIDAARDPHLELAAHHNLAWYLNDAGQGWEARAEVGRSAGLYQRFSGDALASLSRAWLRGRIDRSLNELEQARRWYERAWAGFEELGMESHLAMVAIDRAELQAADGDVAGAGWLLARTLRLLKGWGAGPEALAVLRLLREHVASGEWNRATFRRASLAVRRAWGRAAARAGGEAG